MTHPWHTHNNTKCYPLFVTSKYSLLVLVQCLHSELNYLLKYNLTLKYFPHLLHETMSSRSFENINENIYKSTYYLICFQPLQCFTLKDPTSDVIFLIPYSTRKHDMTNLYHASPSLMFTWTTQTSRNSYIQVKILESNFFYFDN